MSETSATEPNWPAFARSVIAARLAGHDPDTVAPPPDAERPHSGVFVTLRKLKRLRGCIGTLDDRLPLTQAVRHAAVSAAFNDPRFPPLQPAELPDVRIEVSILSPPCRMQRLDELELGRHGIIVQRGQRRGLFLPKVATECGFTRETLLERCCTEKAGLPPDAWKDPDTEVYLFTAETFAEEN